MKAPNRYITIILILSVIYAVYNLVTSSSKNKEKWDSKSIEATESPRGELGLVSKLKEKWASEKDIDKKDRLRMLPWGKDPFIFPEGMDPYGKMKRRFDKKVTRGNTKTSKEVKRKDRPLSVKITSILISEDQKVATIDRAPYVVTIGDRIENAQILEIMPDRVIFGKNGEKQEIFLKSKSKSSKDPRGKNES